MEEDEFGQRDMYDTGRQVIWHGKRLGYYIEEAEGLTFIAPRKLEHKLRIYDGWAMNEEFLRQLFQINVKKIIVKINMGKILVTKPENWIMKGIKFHSRKAEPQIVLPEKSFDKIIDV